MDTRTIQSNNRSCSTVVTGTGRPRQAAPRFDQLRYEHCFVVRQLRPRRPCRRGADRHVTIDYQQPLQACNTSMGGDLKRFQGFGARVLTQTFRHFSR